MENGEWRMENGEWRMWDGELGGSLICGSRAGDPVGAPGRGAGRQGLAGALREAPLQTSCFAIHRMCR
jgi:hypothetical protein